MTPFTAGPPSPHDPFRDPSWRQLRATYLIDQQRRPSRRDDRWVRLACRHLRWLGRAGRTKPPKCLRHVHQASALRQGEGAVRWHLEAHLLTGEGAALAASACGLDVGVVEAYVALHYDVLHLLGAADYVAHRLLPRRAALGVRPDDVGGLLKLAAWKGGPLTLGTALRVLTGNGVPRDRLGSMGHGELEQACAELRCRFWVLVQTLPLDAFRPDRVGRLQTVEEALVALPQEVQEAGQHASRIATADIAAGVMLNGEAGPKLTTSGKAGELLALLHGALDGIEGEYGRRAA
jgi:hypothetical protein